MSLLTKNTGCLPAAVPAVPAGRLHHPLRHVDFTACAYGSCLLRCIDMYVRLPAWLQRFLLYQLADKIIQPFGETAQQVFARVSALREALTGTGFLDQGLVNTDPRCGSFRLGQSMREILGAHTPPTRRPWKSHVFAPTPSCWAVLLAM